MQNINSNNSLCLFPLLPSELLDVILLSLPDDSLAKIFSVSKHFNEISNNENFWEQKCAKLYNCKKSPWKLLLQDEKNFQILKDEAKKVEDKNQFWKENFQKRCEVIDQPWLELYRRSEGWKTMFKIKERKLDIETFKISYPSFTQEFVIKQVLEDCWNKNAFFWGQIYYKENNHPGKLRDLKKFVKNFEQNKTQKITLGDWGGKEASNDEPISNYSKGVLYLHRQ